MEFFQNPQGSLFKLTRGEYDVSMDIISDENPVQQEGENEPYMSEDFVGAVYMNRGD